MEKEFIPYELALKMKTLGFDEKSFKEYDTTRTLQQVGLLESHGLEYISAPTFSQAFRWFRDNYGLYCGFIEPKRMSIREDHNNYYTISSETDEEAEFECLKRLIEIVESKSE